MNPYQRGESVTDPFAESPVPAAHRVVLVPDAEGRLVIFGRDLGALAQALDWVAPAAKLVSELLGGGSEAGIQGRFFTIRPEDEIAYDRLKKAAAGNGYVYGSLRDDSGFAHAMAFREVDGAPVAPAQLPSSVMLATAVQSAAIEQRLAGIEKALEAVGTDVATMLRLLRRDHEASVVAAADVLREVTATTRRTGRISAADWDRIAGLEETVRHRWLAVVDEMQEFGEKLKLTGRIADDRRIPRTLSAARWTQLVQQSYGLERAGLQWASAYALKLQQDGQDDPIAVERVHGSLRALADRRDAIIEGVIATLNGAPTARRRSTWELLLKEGVPGGRHRDSTDLQELASFRTDTQSGSQAYVELAQLDYSPLILEAAVDSTEADFAPVQVAVTAGS